jgi:hypothetical protein
MADNGDDDIQGDDQPQPRMNQLSSQPDASAETPDRIDWTKLMSTMPTWNQADDIDMQRLSNGASYIRNQAMSGRWGPETVNAMSNQLNDQLGPMMMRKKNADDFQQQQQLSQAVHQSALMGGIRAAELQQQAKAFPSTIQELHNPNTGGIDRYIPNGKGGWDIQQSERAEPEVNRDGGDEGAPEGGYMAPDDEGGARPLAPDGQPYGDTPRWRNVVGADGIGRQQRIPTQAEFDAMHEATPKDQEAIASQIAHGTFNAAMPGTPGQGLTASIENGPFREVYQGGQLTQTNRPPFPSQGQEQPSPATGPADFHRQATSIVGPPPQEWYKGAHGQRLPNPQFARWQNDVRAMATELYKNYRQEQQFKEHQRQEEAKASAKENKDRTDKEDAAYAKRYQHHLDSLESQITHRRQQKGQNANLSDILTGGHGDTNDWYTIHRQMAHDRAMDDMRQTNPKYMSPQDRQPPADKPPPGPRAAPLSDDARARLSRLSNVDKKTHAEAAARQKPREVVNPTTGGISPLEMFR